MHFYLCFNLCIQFDKAIHRRWCLPWFFQINPESIIVILKRKWFILVFTLRFRPNWILFRLKALLLRIQTSWLRLPCLWQIIRRIWTFRIFVWNLSLRGQRTTRVEIVYFLLTCKGSCFSDAVEACVRINLLLWDHYK